MMRNFFTILLGLFFLGLGSLIGLLEIIALIDPVGTKMADDADPFGNPYIPWYVHAFYIVFVLACFGFGFWLFNKADKNQITLK
ncbi:hypothetical protein BH20ACI4_BH20ACI4_24980 [soil metagenome]